MTGTIWDVEAVISITDGDTLRVIRSRKTQLGDDWYWLTDTDSKPIRLTWVNTPERGQPGYNKATEDLAYWIGMHRGSGRPTRLRVICYESAGWDRILGDLIDANGDSASQWLMRERGWPPYAGGKK